MLKTLVVISGLLFVFGAFANEAAHQAGNDDSKPATRYSGSTPIDLSRGLPFNNGTYGNRNPEYEAKANSGYTSPGLRASPYTYQEQDQFVSKINALFPIYEDAISNLKSNKDERAEVKAYREQQRTDLETRLEAAKDATKKAGSANENEWNGAQENARKAFTDLQALLVRNNTKY